MTLVHTHWYMMPSKLVLVSTRLSLVVERKCGIELPLWKQDPGFLTPSKCLWKKAALLKQMHIHTYIHACTVMVLQRGHTQPAFPRRPTHLSMSTIKSMKFEHAVLTKKVLLFQRKQSPVEKNEFFSLERATPRLTDTQNNHILPQIPAAGTGRAHLRPSTG